MFPWRVRRNRCALVGLLAALSLLGPWLAAAAELARVDGLRLASRADHTRLVFDLSRPVEHQLFTLSSPDRVVIDLVRTLPGELMRVIPFEDERLTRLRSARRSGDDLRVVLDLARPAEPRTFTLGPQGEYGHRLVVDLVDPSARGEPVALDEPRRPSKNIIVAIDPGHGGRDPGAIGGSGTYEKDVVLRIALELEGLIKAEPGFEAVMTRRDDRYLELRRRVEVAREAQADVFVSIHADAFRRRSARGASVYALSLRGASSEAARWLAARENASDRLAGVDLGETDEVVAKVLLDLAQTSTIERSLALGHRVLDELGAVGDLHKTRVQQAGFVVLKAPDIPSILVESAFISNPHEEVKLQNRSHQRQIAKAILRGLRAYFADNPLSGTWLADTEPYTIRRGDTLSELASRHQVSLDQIREINDLESDVIRIGQTLRLPRHADL